MVVLLKIVLAIIIVVVSVVIVELLATTILIVEILVGRPTAFLESLLDLLVAVLVLLRLHGKGH